MTIVLELLAIYDDEVEFLKTNADGESKVRIIESISADAELEYCNGINKSTASFPNVKNLLLDTKKKQVCDSTTKLILHQRMTSFIY